jgi:hypothetical protein
MACETLFFKQFKWLGVGEISKGEVLYIIPASPFLKLPIFCTSVFLVCPLLVRRVKIATE